MKFDKAEAEALAVLDTMDLSAAIPEFTLADAVLRDRFEDAAKIMRSIGKSGAVLREYAYHDWPLFQTFRTSPLFLEAYEEIYGASFANRVGVAVKSEAITTAATIENRQHEYESTREDLAEEANDPGRGPQDTGS